MGAGAKKADKGLIRLKKRVEKAEKELRKDRKHIKKIFDIIFEELNEREKWIVVLLTAMDFLSKELNIDFKPLLLEAEDLVTAHWDKWKEEARDMEDIQRQIDEIFKDKNF